MPVEVRRQSYALVNVEVLNPHPDNPRQGDVDAIADSIEQNGFFGAIVAQRSTGYVPAGNHRLLAAKRQGLTEVPVVWLDVDDGPGAPDPAGRQPHQRPGHLQPRAADRAARHPVGHGGGPDGNGLTAGAGRKGRGERWFGGNNATTVLESPMPSRSSEHPTMKPVELVEGCLADSCPPDGVVYEPFGGSGSTLIAADRLRMKARLVRAWRARRAPGLFLGYSYGAYLGAVYLQLFPGRTDRVVLDSADDPRRFGARLYQGNEAVTEKALRAWASWAADRHDEYAGSVRRNDDDAENGCRQDRRRTGTYSQYGSAAAAIICGDSAVPRGLEVYWRDIERGRKPHPLFGPIANHVWPCAFWPEPHEPLTQIQ